jgi:hypothetical protein
MLVVESWTGSVEIFQVEAGCILPRDVDRSIVYLLSPPFLGQRVLPFLSVALLFLIPQTPLAHISVVIRRYPISHHASRTYKHC